jgi:hypothetical protein
MEILKMIGMKCPICGRTINGANEKHVKYNLRVHLDRHARKGVDITKYSKEALKS